MTSALRGKTLDVAAGQRAEFVAHTRDAARLEVEDAFFNTASAVFLPDVPGSSLGRGALPVPFTNVPLWAELHRSHDPFATAIRTKPFDPDASGGGSANQRESGLHVILAALRFLEGNPQHALVIAGHTDTSGDPAFNTRLSAARGRSVLALLEAKKTDFVAACAAFNAPGDDPVVLHYAARTRGWPCDPASRDRATPDEVRGFQQTFNRDFAASIDVDGVVGNETRGAYFDLYQADLDVAAGGPEAMRALRGHLRFVSASQKVLALGERFPRENPGQDGLKSQANRRVEMLFFAPPRVPDVAAGDVGEQIFRRRLFTFAALDRDALVSPATPPKSGGEQPGPRLVQSRAAEPGVAEPTEALVTRMPAAGDRDPEDAWLFLEPFDRLHPGVGHQEVPDEERQREDDTPLA